MTEFTTKPEQILYMQLPDGQADVWLRQDIEEVETEDGIVWTANEIYFRTNLSKEEVEENFSALFANDGEIEKTVEITMEERMEAVEEGLAEVAEMVAQSME